jgi:hypothetical protein
MRSLRLHHLEGREFFPVLVSNGTSAPIEFLRISRIKDQGLHLIYIPQMTHLRTLYLSCVFIVDKDHATYVDALSEAVKQNGFLTSVCLNSTNRKMKSGNLSSICTWSVEADHARIERFCHRNRHMGILRENPPSWLGEENDEASNVSRIPALFAVANQSKRAAPSFLLSVLIAVSDGVGPRLGSGVWNKRVHS